MDAEHIQRQFPFSVFSDIVLLTTHRFLVFNRFFTKIEMFELEENRSRTTTMQVNNVLGHPQNPHPQGGQTTFLSHREIANVGD